MTDTATTPPRRTFEELGLPPRRTLSDLISPQTLALVLRVRAVEIQHAASHAAQRVAQDAANWSSIDNASGCYVSTPELRAAMAHAELDWALLNEVYDETPATPDLPSDIFLRVLERRLRDTTKEAWCKQVADLGGPTISPRWLNEYLRGLNLPFKYHLPIPNRLRRAAVLMDANRDEPVAMAA